MPSDSNRDAAKYQKAYYQRMKEDGWVRLQEWVPKELLPEARRVVQDFVQSRIVEDDNV